VSSKRWKVGISVAAICSACLGVAIVGAAQRPATDQASLEFDAVSIKPPVPGPGGERFSSDPTMLRIKASSFRLIEFAYQNPNIICPQELRSVSNEAHELIANASVPTTREQQRVMLQRVLAERFKFKFHIETKDGPVLALVLGPKPRNLEEVEANGEFGIKVTPSPDYRQDDSFLLKGRHVSMTEVAKWMSGGGKPVIDKTGLTGRYNFDLRAPMAHQGDMIGLPVEVQNDVVVQHFGLKLQAERGSIETLVIDHIERPSEN